MLRQDLLVADPGSLVLRFENPFRYNGTNSLAIDLSFDNQSYTEDGFCRSVETSDTRGRIFESDSAFGPPLSWSGQTPPAELVNRVPEIRFLIDEEVTLLPTVTGSFSQGVWTGSITLMAEAEELTLEALSQEGIVASSDVFRVTSEGLPPQGPRIARLSFREADVVIEFLGEPDRFYQLESAVHLIPAAWESVGAPVGGALSGITAYAIGGAGHPRRFYRVRQLP